MEQEIGKVIHYFDKAMVAVIRLSSDLKIGDTVKFIHGENEFTQTVDSIQVEHKPIKGGKSGEEVAVKVEQETKVGTRVLKIS
ncbi:MAG: hypothetical protein AB1643_01345 [Patescibacteria group bacterium]